MKNKRRSGVKRARKRKGEGQQSRHEILAAAKRLFVQEGYEATTIRRIAANVGISSTALYVYFKDKDAILAEICNETFAALIQKLDTVRRDFSDPLSALEHALEGYIRFGLDHPNEYELTFISRPSKELKESDPGIEELGTQAFDGFYGCVDAVVQAGLTNESDADRLTHQLWAGAHGLVALLLLRPGLHWGESDSLIRGHVAMLIHGAANPSSER
jgi:AcrR family transcriptional regulator